MPRGWCVGFSSFSSRSSLGRKFFPPRASAAKINSFLSAAKKTRFAAFSAAKKRSASSGSKTNTSSSSFHSEKVVSTEDEEEKEETKGGRDWTEKMVKSENFEKGKARALGVFEKRSIGRVDFNFEKQMMR